MTNENLAERCVLDMKARLATVPSLVGKIVQVYSEEELANAFVGVSFPCMGVVYEGMRSVNEPGSTLKQGVSNELIVSLVVAEKGSSPGESDSKIRTMHLLDAARKAVRAGGSAPGGHKWKFVLEAPASEKKGVVLWVQRWATPVLLP